ncbi:MAG: hypothetical protein AB1630_05785 [bacterium]
MKKKLSEEEIDKIVAEQADNDSAWEEPIHVRKTKPTSLSIPAEIAGRAAFLARLHREAGIEEWLMRIIRERIEIEEVAFVEAKHDIAVKGNT